MAYAPPTVGPAGLTVPTYQDIFLDQLGLFQIIYGSTVYIGIDSPDYQWISSFCLKLADVMSAIQLAYGSRSPLTAIGYGLDAIGKINDVTRKAASFSTCTLAVGGDIGAVLTNCRAKDVNGFIWDLPPTVTIPGSGTINVTAICETPGNINAIPGDINTKFTPTAGWNTVTNPGAAVPGLPVESDAQFRARQSLSVALPSSTRLEGTVAAIAGLPGVSRYNVVENPTNSTDGFGNPPHSITAVVEGGADATIAQAIYDNKSIGCFTNGTTTVPVSDPTGSLTIPISFDRPTYRQIWVLLNIHPLTGYTSATTDEIRQGVVDYENSLQIGQSAILSEYYGAALTARPNPDQPLFSIRGLWIGTTISSILTATVGASGGTGYVVGNVLTVVQGGASSGQVTVTTIGVSGVVTGISVLPPSGIGYTIATNLATTGGAGTGCQVNVTAVAPNTTADIAIAFNEVALGLLVNTSVAII